MNQSYNLSPVLCELLEFAESTLGTEIQLVRRTDVPPQGVLIDDFTFGTGKHMIAFSSSQLGMLKDYTICRHCLELLAKGCAARSNEFRVISFATESARPACGQIYLDILKDEATRNIAVWRKKQLLFLLYMLFHEAFSELPLTLLANIVIARRYPVIRNAQVYFLLKESMRDMHDLVPVKEFLPQRYFVLHNGMYYARDMLLAYVLSEFKLNPVINIPELQRFRNLDVKEMMSHRWSRSPWYHTKMVGDALSNILKLTITMDMEQDLSEQYFRDLFTLGREVLARWWVMMGMQEWFLWESPEHLKAALASQEVMERTIQQEIFGSD
ncbi:MAG: hypothetical protein MUC66_07020 [Methanolinea sp.]|jgi:hypothetical protein|nr:hypothetical protein [Methanolinea sp.]